VDAELQTQANLVNVPAVEVPVQLTKSHPWQSLDLCCCCALSIVSTPLVRLYGTEKVALNAALTVKGLTEVVKYSAGILLTDVKHGLHGKRRQRHGRMDDSCCTKLARK
jgi:hypothetical protein